MSAGVSKGPNDCLGRPRGVARARNAYTDNTYATSAYASNAHARNAYARNANARYVEDVCG